MGVITEVTKVIDHGVSLNEVHVPITNELSKHMVTITLINTRGEPISIIDPASGNSAIDISGSPNGLDYGALNFPDSSKSEGRRLLKDLPSPQVNCMAMLNDIKVELYDAVADAIEIKVIVLSYD